jgi:hypothetical protein
MKFKHFGIPPVIFDIYIHTPKLEELADSGKEEL